MSCVRQQLQWQHQKFSALTTFVFKCLYGMYKSTYIHLPIYNDYQKQICLMNYKHCSNKKMIFFTIIIYFSSNYSLRPSVMVPVDSNDSLHYLLQRETIIDSNHSIWSLSPLLWHCFNYDTICSWKQPFYHNRP